MTVLDPTAVGELNMSGCFMLQSKGVCIKDSFLKFTLPYQSFFFDRLLMMVTSYLVGKERL